jgi:hypothetical protein
MEQSTPLEPKAQLADTSSRAARAHTTARPAPPTILAFFVHDALTPAIMTAIWFSLALVPVTVDVVIVAMEKLGRERCLALFTLLV